MNSDKFKYYDYLLDDEDSDIDEAESSEDEIDIILHGTQDQKRRLSRSMSGQESSESDFEKEMRQELDEQVEAIEAARRTPDRGGPKQSSSDSKQAGSTSNDPDTGQSSSGTQKFYDDIYFDSDEEEMVASGDERVKKRKKKQKLISNDDLLYDPDADDEDQDWVDKHRRSYQPKSRGNKPTKLPQSDAVLDCPACMTTLCLDCQRHDVYQGQYRAMFVMNCKVDRSELLKYPNPPDKKKKKKKGKTKQTDSVDKAGTSSSVTDGDTELNDERLHPERELSDNKLHPVRCEECNTVVAVFDHEEVYHFFNVLASY